ncbi:CD109 antigen-like isoform X2 [Saccostrea cucullata]|uniref:CD109 antigen-like isoform X2 n=1 Tax=Saccostrea cuccullata TaxID=36930 RepID=UPI002ED5A3EA
MYYANCCLNKVQHCGSYGQEVCQKTVSRGWAKENCPMFCNVCPGVMTGTGGTFTDNCPTCTGTGATSTSTGGAFTGTGGVMTGTGGDTHNTGIQPLHTHTVWESSYVRAKFPETWLWASENIGASGYATIPITVPDSITSWVASAFSVNRNSGLGITDAISKLTVFRPFFLSLIMPNHIIRGEEVVLQVIVFNYLNENLTVLVTLEQNRDFLTIVVDDLGYEHLEIITKSLSFQVCSECSETVYFPIIPITIGDVNVEVKAQSVIAADAVRRQIRVEPEGVLKERTESHIVSLNNGATFYHNTTIEFPSSVVKGSEQVQILVTGDYMVPSIKGLEKLITLPTGCGEQTLIGFAPDVFIYEYLKKSGQLTAKWKRILIDYIEKGYQRELSFQRYDGSYNFWYSGSSSIWLTAYVLKCFAQAAKHIDINTETLQKTQKWLIGQQRSDGYFYEHGETYDKQKGYLSEKANPAFALVALAESSRIISNNESLTAMQKARHYLERNIQLMVDPYEVALSAYALLLSGSPMAESAIRKLEGCEGEADVVFLVDSSARLGKEGFQLTLQYIANMINRFTGKTRVSLITFGLNTHEVFSLNSYRDIIAIKAAILMAPYRPSMTIDSYKALRYMQQNSFREANGGRRNASKIVILMTANHLTNPSQTATVSSELRSAGVILFAVGIENAWFFLDELVKFTGDFKSVEYTGGLSNPFEYTEPVNFGVYNCKVYGIEQPWTARGKDSSFLTASTYDIETASYALLYYSNKKQYPKAKNVMKWILEQRNALGGFMSTQDTVIALQALSEMSVWGDFKSMDIYAYTPNEDHYFLIRDDNKMVLQKYQPSTIPPFINISAHGEGAALVQVVVKFNVMEQQERPAFTLDILSTMESMDINKIQVCARYNGTSGFGSGMTIIEFGIPSGFDVDFDNILGDELKKKEEVDNKLALYFDQIKTKTESCLNLTLIRSSMVGKVKPSPVRVYEYYNPSNQVTSFYTPLLLQKSSYCDVCPQCKCAKHRK